MYQQRVLLESIESESSKLAVVFLPIPREERYSSNRPVLTQTAYKVTSSTPKPYGVDLILQLDSAAKFHGVDVPSLRAMVSMDNDERIHVKISDANSKRYEVL